MRDFSSQKVDINILINAIDTARMSPSGANKQPWSFAIIADQEKKKEIRGLCEEYESQFYKKGDKSRWVKDLKHLHTNSEKSSLTEASFLVPIFYSTHDLHENGETSTNYFAKESVGIATGILISSLHLSGLSTLTYTPTNMSFLTKYLNRPKNEKLFLVLLVGLPSKDAKVPVIEKKELDQILTIYNQQGTESVQGGNYENFINDSSAYVQ